MLVHQLIVKLNGQPIDLGNVDVLQVPKMYYDAAHTPVYIDLSVGSTQIYNGDLNPLNAIAKAGHDLIHYVSNINIF